MLRIFAQFACITQKCTPRLAEPTQRVGGYIVSITSPPDARYAPLRPALKRGPRTYPLVRALVLPLLDAPGSEKVCTLHTIL